MQPEVSSATCYLTLSHVHTTVYPEVSELAVWSENCKWYSSVPLGSVYRYFMSQSSEFCRRNPLYCFSTSVYCCKAFISVSTQSGNFWIQGHEPTYSTVMCSLLYFYVCNSHFRQWIRVEVLWIMTPCTVVVAYQRFRGPCCLHFMVKLVSYHNSTQRYNPEDLEFSLHRRESLNF
jgi:hypothetical protein